MWRDTRAQSVGIARFLLSLVVAGILAFIASRVATPILDNTPSGNPTAAQATGWLQTGVDSLFIAFIVIAVFGLIALSVFQREVLG